MVKFWLAAPAPDSVDGHRSLFPIPPIIIRDGRRCGSGCRNHAHSYFLNVFLYLKFFENKIKILYYIDAFWFGLRAFVETSAGWQGRWD
jgi:hypothetical protein